MPKNIKNRPYVRNLDKYADVGTHWIALFRRKSEIVYFNSFGAEHVPEEIKEFIGNKNIKANIFRIQQHLTTFALNSLILCLLVKNSLILRVCFLFMVLRKREI